MHEARWQEDRAHRHLDAARLGNTGIRLLVGRLRLGVPRARWQDRPRRLALTRQAESRTRSRFRPLLGGRAEPGVDAPASDARLPEVLRRTGEPEGGDDLAGPTPRDRIVGAVPIDEG